MPDPKGAGVHEVHIERTIWHDAARQRSLPLCLYLPESDVPTPFVIFSHGLGGSREGGRDWLFHWAAHGIGGIAVQHPGSDDAVFAGQPTMALRRVLRDAMDVAQLAARAADLAFVMDRLGAGAVPQADAARLGIAGHSFGAVTVQALSGERLSSLGTQLRDDRPKASIAFSPSARGDQASLPERFAGIDRPFFSITGSRDDGIGLGDIDPGNRTQPFQHMPPPHKYLLVLEGGSHLDFAGHASDAETGFARRRHPARRDVSGVVRAATTAFWLAHLGLGGDARRLLDPTLLDAQDRFSAKHE